MKISIECYDKSVFQVEVPDNSNVHVLKNIISKDNGIRVENIMLMFQGKVLEDGKYLCDDYKISSATKLTLKVQRKKKKERKDEVEENMVVVEEELKKEVETTVNICSSGDDKMTYNIPVDFKHDKIVHLKRKLAAKANLNLGEISLMFSGRILQDEKLVSSYDIDMAPTSIQLVIKKKPRVLITKVCFELDNSTRANIDLYSGDSVTSIKEKLHKEFGIAPGKMMLMFSGRVMEDGKIVDDFGFQGPTSVTVRTVGMKKKKPMMKKKETQKKKKEKPRVLGEKLGKLGINIIGLGILGQREVRVDYYENDTVGSVKKRISEQENIDDEIQFLFAGRVLQDDKLITEHDYSTSLTMRIKKKGKKETTPEKKKKKKEERVSLGKVGIQNYSEGGSMLHVDIYEGDTVGDMKKRMVEANRGKFGGKELKFIFTGKVVSDSDVVDGYVGDTCLQMMVKDSAGAATTDEVVVETESESAESEEEEEEEGEEDSEEEGEEEPKIRVHVHLPRKGSVVLDVTKNDSIGNMVQNIAKEKKVSADSIKILNCGRVLENDQTVEECEISSGDTLSAYVGETKNNPRVMKVMDESDDDSSGDEEDEKELEDREEKKGKKRKEEAVPQNHEMKAPEKEKQEAGKRKEEKKKKKMEAKKREKKQEKRKPPPSSGNQTRNPGGSPDRSWCCVL